MHPIVIRRQRQDPISQRSSEWGGIIRLEFGNRPGEVVVTQTLDAIDNPAAVAAKESKHLIERQILATLEKNRVDFIKLTVRIGLYLERRQTWLMLEQRDQVAIPRGEMKEMILDRPTILAWPDQCFRRCAGDKGFQFTASDIHG